MANRLTVAVCALFAILTGLPDPARSEPIVVGYKSIDLDSENPDNRTTGALLYRGGLVLSSAESRFGGFSALGISADGKRLISLSDRGHRLSAHLLYDAAGDLIGLEQTDLSSVAGLDGRPLSSKYQSDIESMSPGVEGEIIVSFERNHRLWRYLPGQTTPEPLPPPEGLDRLPANSGIEGLTLLDDGRLLALSEGSEKADNAIGWVSDTGGWSPLTYQLTDGFRVTGAATHPHGDVFVLERYFTLRQGLAVRIKRVPARHILAGAELHGELIAELRSPLHVDNFEGIEMRTTADNRTFVYLISDDNFNPLQSTLLMMFEVLAP
ncbi:MAG: esterase-like activity of phytase family protein [Rhodospirillales bacterium]|nr:esterase-like activity of phytase family protein [Rhodospirillales bacterium]